MSLKYLSSFISPIYNYYFKNQESSKLESSPEFYSKAEPSVVDLQDWILAKGQTVPVITKKILECRVDDVLYHTSSAEFGTIAEVLIDGVRTIVSNDPNFADQVFKSKVFIERSANDEGLIHLGMKNRGLIWNNDNDSWKQIRKVFQTSLKEKDLQYAREIASREVLVIVTDYLRNSQNGCLNFLEIFRKVTFHVTMELFCNVTLQDLIDNGICEDDVIASIVNYFKAWEYFLFRPNCKLDQALFAKHQKSVEDLNVHVKKLIKCSVEKRNRAENLNHAKTMFDKFMDLELEPEMLGQSFLEMLLAGTDTSSVTMYYAMLGLAGSDQISVNFQRTLHELAGTDDGQFDQLVDQLSLESLRFKPVGPVIIRQANADVTLTLPNGLNITIEKGEGAIINVESMNYLPGIWENPNLFNPARDDLENNKGKFFPFGDGPKGCVGKYLGLAEVRAALKSLIPEYKFEIVGKVSLQTLETHWDIANQPDEPPMIRCIPRA